MSETAIKQAFDKAGVKSADERLREITLKAMVEHADNTFATCDAIWAEVQKHRDLMAHLFQWGWRREVSALMQRVQKEIVVAEQENRLRRPIERKAANVVALIRREDARQEAEDRAAEARAQAQQDRENAERLAQWRATYVGRVEINETPVWQLASGTVRTWLATERRRHRTLELLIEGLPDDGRPIEYYRKPEDVAELWRRAGE